MKTKILLLSIFSTLYLYSQTVQEVIEYSLLNNYQIQTLQEEFGIVDAQANIVGAWRDPILKVGVSDIQAVRPLSRNIEAMQNQYVSLSQTIPLSNHLEIASDVEKEKLLVLEQKREVLNVNIAFEVRKAFIEAQYAKISLKILDDYIAFLKRPLSLLVGLSAIEQNGVEKYIKTELLQKSYQLQRESWLQSIQIAKERLELIGNIHIDNFSDEVTLKDYSHRGVEELLSVLNRDNPQLKMQEVLKNVATKDIELARAKEEADITVTGGYYQRFDRNDYVSLSVSLPLYIHKKQEKQRVQAIKKSNIQDISYKQTKVQLEQELKITLHQLKSLKQELKILNQTQSKIENLIANAKSELLLGGSLLHYYELFTQKINNQLAINKKHLAIALKENQIYQLLGVVQ